MFDRMQSLSESDIKKIHDASMSILKEIGVYFDDEKVGELFKSHGYKVEGKIVFFEEKEVLNAMEKVPSKFEISARNDAKSVSIGEESFVFAPGYGAPFIMDYDGTRRNANMEDYNNLCKIIHTSEYIDCNGFMMVEPHDVPAVSAHLDMLYSNITLSDKVFMGSPVSLKGAEDAIKIAEMIWGNIKNRPVMISLINSISPLKYSKEMIDSLMKFAEYGQPCIVAPLIMGGASGPIKIAGLLAQQNAEILAGIIFAQLINEGTPVIYGSASSITDLKTGSLSVGAPELAQIVSATAQIARYYSIPSRAGGAITDSHIPDIQAGIESAFALYTAARNGVNFILHSAGILNSYLAMSYEKFLIDEEICGMVKRILRPIEVSDESLSFDIIKEVGIGGEFLSHPKTLELCRTEYYNPLLMFRDNYEGWLAKGKKRLDEIAQNRLNERLESYKKPDIGKSLEKDLKNFIEKRKEEIKGKVR